MFAVRLISLPILCFLGVMASYATIDLVPPLGYFSMLLVLFTASFLYMLPTYEAWKNEQPNLMSIGLVNFFLGWSLIGWVVAIAWAFKKPTNEDSVSVNREAAVSRQEMKKCPFCAEDVLVAAVKCKHCGSDLSLDAVNS